MKPSWRWQKASSIFRMEFPQLLTLFQGQRKKRKIKYMYMYIYIYMHICDDLKFYATLAVKKNDDVTRSFQSAKADLEKTDVPFYC